MTWDIKNYLLQKYWTIVEGAVDNIIVRWPDFYERIINYELYTIIIPFIIVFVLFIISMIVAKKWLDLKKDFEGMWNLMCFTWLIFSLCFFIVLVAIINDMIKILYVPEIYLYSKYIAW